MYIYIQLEKRIPYLTEKISSNPLNTVNLFATPANTDVAVHVVCATLLFDPVFLGCVYRRWKTWGLAILPKKKPKIIKKENEKQRTQEDVETLRQR